MLHKWIKQCVKVFEDIKEEITTDQVLTTFSPNLLLILATDASPHGLSTDVTQMERNGQLPLLQKHKVKQSQTTATLLTRLL